MKVDYDSKGDTLEHIRNVAANIMKFIRELTLRAERHDFSKLIAPEKEVFDEVTPKLKELKFGTPEYEENLKSIQDTLETHYALNSHHPQHYPNGVHDMTLIDIVEMLCDWKAASLRTKGGNIQQSIDECCKRYKIDAQLRQILLNTAEKMGL